MIESGSPEGTTLASGIRVCNGIPYAAQQVTIELGEKTGARPVAEKEKLAFFTQYFARQR